jgi:hypothetical protein
LLLAAPAPERCETFCKIAQKLRPIGRISRRISLKIKISGEKHPPNKNQGEPLGLLPIVSLNLLGILGTILL